MADSGNREAWLSWRRGCFFLTGMLFLTIFINLLPHRPSIPLLKSSNPSSSAPQHTSPYNLGDPQADNGAIDGLTHAQCDAEFPDLYTDIDRAVSYWKSQSHTITAEETNLNSSRAAMRILIHDNAIRVLESKGSVQPVMTAPERALGLLYLLQSALDSSREILPTIEVTLNFQDGAEPGETHSFWTFARHVTRESHQRLWLMPNYDFWYDVHTRAFVDARHDAMQRDGSFTGKIPKLVWRGNEAFGAEIRNGLLSATRGKDWADVLSVNDMETWMSVDEFCKWAMTVYTEGVTYSGRLKHLMNCQSLLFTHEPLYETHYSHLMVKEGPEQNVVSVKRDWSNLEEKVEYYLAHPDESEKIIQNMLETFRSRYTTRAATSCYIRRLIRSYAEVAWTPEVHVPMKDGAGGRLRGYAFEKFLYKPEDRDFEGVE